MTTNTEVTWEDVTFGQLREGDEIEYIRKNEFSEFKYWGKILFKENYGRTLKVEGDWYLDDVVDRQVQRGQSVLKRKVIPFTYPTKIGAVIKVERVDSDPTFYVRVDDRADNAVWVLASNGDRLAEWELELIHSNDKFSVVTEGN